MKTTLLTVAVIFFSAMTLRAVQEEKGAPDKPSAGQSLLSRNPLRGFVDFAVAPPHNEPDLGRCALVIGPCSTFPRYVLSGYVEFQPIARGAFRRVFLFFEPNMYFGDNIPQQKYTYSAQPMAMTRVLGLGIEMTKNLELRAVHHRVYYFGRYAGVLGPQDIGSDKPLGLYSTFGVRWYFGGWGRHR